MDTVTGFKVGDRVRLVSTEDLGGFEDDPQVGDIGYVRAVNIDANPDLPDMLRVAWPGREFEDGSDVSVVAATCLEPFEASIRYTPAQACNAVRSVEPRSAGWRRLEDMLDQLTKEAH